LNPSTVFKTGKKNKKKMTLVLGKWTAQQDGKTEREREKGGRRNCTLFELVGSEGHGGERLVLELAHLAHQLLDEDCLLPIRLLLAVLLLLLLVLVPPFHAKEDRPKLRHRG